MKMYDVIGCRASIHSSSKFFTIWVKGNQRITICYLENEHTFGVCIAEGCSTEPTQIYLHHSMEEMQSTITLCLPLNVCQQIKQFFGGVENAQC